MRLGDLLSMEDPRVKLRDGSFHSFRREELEFLAALLDDEDVLRLPIVIEIDGPKIRVRGRVEVKVIDMVLGSYDPLENAEEKTYHRYLLSIIRRKLPTTTTIAFAALPR